MNLLLAMHLLLPVNFSGNNIVVDVSTMIPKTATRVKAKRRAVMILDPLLLFAAPGTGE